MVKKSTKFVYLLSLIVCVVIYLSTFSISLEEYRVIFRKNISKIETKIAHLSKVSPKPISITGTVNSPGAHIQISNSQSAVAVISNSNGKFTLDNVIWYPGTIYKLNIENSFGENYQTEFLAPFFYPSIKAFGLPTIYLEKCNNTSTEELDGFPSTWYQQYDQVNDNFYKQLFDEVTGGKNNDEEKIITITRYIAQKRMKKRRIDFEATPIRILGDKNPHSYSCGELANAMAMLIYSKNYRVRSIDIIFKKSEEKDLYTHVLVEVFYNNSWHLFDPTYGVFYRKYNGQIASYADICLDTNLLLRHQYTISIQETASEELPSMYGSGLHRIYMIHT